ncbi:fumarylacetoacetate hydrolase family protein [Kitasatospora sp. NPDC057223]|uniref:fumarylacetoacetate hydrolase family protein n=1 Tax=Kitasatospora sp. NPDC057223 TaxID=3346055 RepID=UPI003626BA8E
MTEPGRADSPGTRRPGKIIAVHAGYASRAAESGSLPANPSYFLKPSSSLAASGGEVERPAGTGQLTCEGEVALVIGRAARRVGREEAWSHVGWVTAANDLGVGDLRAQDHGSLLRSKGGDGFTPLGPGLIDAAAVDPDGLRVRTWVNGRLVQVDTTAGLLFPLPQIVADLSQHLTLEPGDVILTGTPAGSRVLDPGDVVEVEVDAPARPDAPTSGRLRTTVVAGEIPFDPALGALPAPPARPAVLSAALREKLARTPVAGLSAQLRKHGLDNVHIDGPRPLTPGSRIVGTARTLRFVPNREDLFAAHGGGQNAQKRAFDAVSAGEVLVIEARGEPGAATLGDILAIRAHVRGAAGIVTDGGVRDADTVAGVGIPVFALGRHPAVLGRRHIPWDHDLTVACGGATVQPGDVIVADSDGIVVIPPALAEEVADAALAQEDEDGWIAEQVRAGHGIDGLFPMDAHWRARYTRRGTGQ